MDEKYPDSLLREILESVRTIAVVGLSHKPERPSHEVFNFLQGKGYRALGVNPGFAGTEILGAPVYARLADIPGPVDMVDIFRRSSEVAGLVDAVLALETKPRVIWMQLGVHDEFAAERARAKGITVIMNRCPKIEFLRLFGE
jgi:predicted CoA-binding protein